MNEIKNHILCDVSDCGKLALYKVRPFIGNKIWKKIGNLDFFEGKPTSVFEDDAISGDQYLCEEHAKKAGVIL